MRLWLCVPETPLWSTLRTAAGFQGALRGSGADMEGSGFYFGSSPARACCQYSETCCQNEPCSKTV